LPVPGCRLAARHHGGAEAVRRALGNPGQCRSGVAAPAVAGTGEPPAGVFRRGPRAARCPAPRLDLGPGPRHPAAHARGQRAPLRVTAARDLRVIRIAPEMLERHGAPAPRYTSYPAAMHWGAAPRAADWLAALRNRLSREGARAGLYVHVPFCGALCTFCGCNMRVARSHAFAEPYVTTVLNELALYRAGLGQVPAALGGLYLGGGSP